MREQHRVLRHVLGVLIVADVLHRYRPHVVASPGEVLHRVALLRLLIGKGQSSAQDMRFQVVKVQEERVFVQSLGHRLDSWTCRSATCWSSIQIPCSYRTRWP